MAYDRILVLLPEHALIDVMLRCRRGHEEPGRYYTPDGAVYVVRDGPCRRCLLEDYGRAGVEFDEREAAFAEPWAGSGVN